MLAELAAMAAEKRTAEQAERLGEMAYAFATSEDDRAAQQVDFAFMTELAQAAQNIVFVLILNSIRALYFEHAALLPVTSGREELAPFYDRAARAVARRQPAAARKAVAELAAAQRARVEALLGGG